MEVQSLRAPQRQAFAFLNHMVVQHRNRSMQVAGAGAATEHAFPTDANATELTTSDMKYLYFSIGQRHVKSLAYL